MSLKRCPFCGGLAKTQVEVASMGGESDRIDFSVSCTKCGTRKAVNLYVKHCSSFTDVEKAMELVTKEWNRRMTDE